MAQKGLFFNAFPDSAYETGYDRNYSADDISNWLKVVISTGIVKTDSVAGTGEPQGFKVLASSGMIVKINAGLACINGKPFILDAQHSSNLPTAPTAGVAYECFYIRYNNEQTLSGRKIALSRRRLDHIPTVADCTRTEEIYELCFAYIEVRANATTIQQTDIYDLRGDKDLCPWVVAVKGYEDYYDAIVQRFEDNITLSSATKNVTTSLASSLYNAKYSLISVYVNGLKEEDSKYTVNTSNAQIVIKFTGTKAANAQISVILENFLDGEGLSNVLSEYSQFVNDVANLKVLNEFNYYCNGNDDNVKLSTLIKNFISAGATPATLKLNVIGTFGMSAPAAGDGSSANPYKIFDFGNSDGTRKYIIDFANCSVLQLAAYTDKTTLLFSGGCGQILNAIVNTTNTSGSTTNVKVFSDHKGWLVKNCSFKIFAFKDTILAYCGTFENCKGEIYNVSGSGWCFFPRTNKLLRVIGGDYKGYTRDATQKSAVIGQNQAGNTVLLGVNCPTVAKSGYYQTHSIYMVAGKLASFGLISALPIEKAATGSSISGSNNLNVTDECW